MNGILRAALAAALVLAAGTSQAATAPTYEIPKELIAIADSLHPRHGKIALPEAHASLDLGDKYDFYSGADVASILVTLWGNPPGSDEGVLGIVMPAGASPLSDAWGAVVTFEDVGYVSDDDADEVDFDELLVSLKENSEAGNEERRQAGYPPIHIAGWAEYPDYDPKTHSVIWARNLNFEGDPVNALNYDLRTLGRHGVLSVNFVSVMPALAEIRTAADDFAGHAHFDTGSRYEDYRDGDRVAEYGIGGLVAAGVGVAVAKKLGLLALLAKFGKLIIIGIGVAVAASWSFIKRLFGQVEEEPHYEAWESEMAEPEAPASPEAAASSEPGNGNPPPG